MWTTFSLIYTDQVSKNREILWTMRGNFNDELIYGMISGWYSVYDSQEFPEYYFEGINSERGYIPYIDKDLEYNYFIKHVHDYIIWMRYPNNDIEYGYSFDSLEWLRGLLTMYNAIHVDYRDYTGDVLDRNGDHYSIET